jgi:hypothetical protein
MKATTWVVYLMTVRGKPEPVRAVCEQSEWEAIERSWPGQHRLVQAGITSETEAEKLARGTSGDPVPRTGALPRRSP